MEFQNQKINSALSRFSSKLSDKKRKEQSNNDLFKTINGDLSPARAKSVLQRVRVAKMRMNSNEKAKPKFMVPGPAYID